MDSPQIKIGLIARIDSTSTRDNLTKVNGDNPRILKNLLKVCSYTNNGSIHTHAWEQVDIIEMIEAGLEVRIAKIISNNGTQTVEWGSQCFTDGEIITTNLKNSSNNGVEKLQIEELEPILNKIFNPDIIFSNIKNWIKYIKDKK